MASVPSRTITDDRLQRCASSQFPLHTAPRSQPSPRRTGMPDSADASDAPTPSSDDPMAVSPNADAADTADGEPADGRAAAACGRSVW